MIPLSVLARNQTNGLNSISRRDRKLEGNARQRVRQRNSERSWEGWREWPVDTGQQRDELAWERVQSSEEDRWGLVGIPSSFVEVSLEIYASISLHINPGNAECYITPLLALELTLAYFSFVRLFFFSRSLDCISCSYGEMCDALSEPLVDDLPSSEMVLKRLTYSGGRGGIVTIWH